MLFSMCNIITIIIITFMYIINWSMWIKLIYFCVYVRVYYKQEIYDVCVCLLIDDEANKHKTEWKAELLLCSVQSCDAF